MSRTIPQTVAPPTVVEELTGYQWMLESLDGVSPTIDFRNSPQNLDTPPTTISLSEGVDMVARELTGTMNAWSITSSGFLWPDFSTSNNTVRYAMSVTDLLALGGGPAHSLDDRLFWVWVLRNTVNLTQQPLGDYFAPVYQDNPRSQWAFAGGVDGSGALRMVRRSNLQSAQVVNTALSTGDDIYACGERIVGKGRPAIRTGYAAALPTKPEEQDAWGTDMFGGDDFVLAGGIADPYISPGWNDNGGTDPSAILESLYLYRLRQP